jgi:hypothetical protein
MNGVKSFESVCSLCGAPVAGRADPKAGATVPAPGLGEGVRCLVCVLGLTKDADLLVKGELAEV